VIRRESRLEKWSGAVKADKKDFYFFPACIHARVERIGESPSGAVDVRSPLHVMPITSATIMIFTRMFLLLNNIMTIRAVHGKKARRRKSLLPGGGVCCSGKGWLFAASHPQSHLTLSRRLAYWTKVLLLNRGVVEGFEEAA
jgi:hypothetical protein